jgi:hypothetical protein
MMAVVRLVEKEEMELVWVEKALEEMVVEEDLVVVV